MCSSSTISKIGIILNFLYTGFGRLFHRSRRPFFTRVSNTSINSFPTVVVSLACMIAIFPESLSGTDISAKTFEPRLSCALYRRNSRIRLCGIGNQVTIRRASLYEFQLMKCFNESLH